MLQRKCYETAESLSYATQQGLHRRYDSIQSKTSRNGFRGMGLIYPLLAWKTHGYPDGVDSTVFDPFPIAFFYPSIPMMFEDFFGGCALGDIPVTLGWVFRAAKGFLCNPSLEYEP